MWSQYDEDLSQNEFFREIQLNHKDILKRAAKEHWIICIPRRGSLKNDSISVSVILDHVLIQTDETNYSTLSKKDIHLDNNHLKLDQNTIFRHDIEILFEETHYVEQTAKYIVWCINGPLFQQQSRKQYSNNNIILQSIQDCIDFLYSEAFGHNLLEGIQRLCTDFWKDHDNSFQTESMQGQKDYLGNLYSQCLQLCFKSDIISEKCNKNVACLDNFKISIETYMQYSLGKKLMYSVNTLQHFTDSMLNKTLRNSPDITLSSLNIPEVLSDLVIDAKYELSRINNYVTVLDKMYCLSRTFNIFNNKVLHNDNQLYVTSDDFLQIFVYLMLKCNISNWVGNLTYLKEFQFASFGHPDQTNFLVTTLEAAIAFIESSQFLSIRQGLVYSTINDQSDFDGFYIKFKDKRSVTELDKLMAHKKDKVKSNLCHPLCSCPNCEIIRTQKVEKVSYKILNNLEQNFLIVASIENNIDFLEFLLLLDFDINFKDIYGKTALHYAAQNGFQDILMLLINAKADVNVLDNDKNTPLHLSCDRGHDNCTKALVYSSPLAEINLQNISGETPLFLATRWGYFDIIKFLLENGASVCLKNNRNMSIYQLCPNYYITQLFEQFGSQKSNKILKEVSKNKNKPFDNVPNISESCCNKMFSNSQEQNVMFGIRTKSAIELKKVGLLLKAIISNDLPLTFFYLGYNSSSIENHGVESKKCHPLCTCQQCIKVDDSLESNMEQKVKSDCQINVNMCDDKGFTPLHVAAQFGRTEILRALLDNGAILNVRVAITFYTPLHLAVMFQRLPIIKELLKCGNCNIDAQDYKGNTPLYYACVRHSNNLKIVELLLQNGANCQKKNFKEKTILQICEESNLFMICRMLRDSMGLGMGCSSHIKESNSFENVDSDSEFL